MKNYFFHFYIVTLLLLLFSTSIFSQERTLKGVLEDEEGEPLPGVNVVIKGTNTGTQTDFDGNYSIDCNVGDVLVFSFIGMDTKEVVITSDMFNDDNKEIKIKQEAVSHIISDKYIEAITLKNKKANNFNIPDISNSRYKYRNNTSYLQYERIKSIEIQKEKNKVQLTYFEPDIFYEVGWNTTTGVQFVKQSNLPKLQQTFAQGQPFEGQNTYFGPDSNVFFSYGPRLSNLQFNAIDTPYDQNGVLIPIGSGSGANSIAYDNEIFDTSFKTINTVFFNVATDKDYLGLEYKDERIRDIFDKENNRFHEVALRYNNLSNTEKNSTWDASLKYTTQEDNQPNLNGFFNTVLLTNWATPVSFENRQGVALENGLQRSFSSQNFNNPFWLLDFNRNQITQDALIAGVQNTFRFSDVVTLNTNISNTYTTRAERFGVIPNTAGFTNGFASDKEFDTNTFNATALFSFTKTYKKSEIDFNSKVDYTNKDLKYSLQEQTGFTPLTFDAPETISNNNKTINRNTLRLSNMFAYNIIDWNTKISFTNSSYVSSIQNDKWFLPNLQVDINLREALDMYWLNRLKISAGAALEINETPLYYANQSHNSLDITPQQIQGFVSNDDLFVSDDLQLEEKKSYSISTQIGFELFHNKNIDLSILYYHHTDEKVVFPVESEGQFQLQNSADINNYGLEASLHLSSYHYGGFTYSPSLVFTWYRNEVKRIYSDEDRIPIAGFSTISKNLIPGQSAGVIVGSAYARDSENNMIIDDQGFPLVATTSKIIGDPTPDFTIGFSNSFYYRKLRLNFLIDYQKGGDVWNGTQNVLNYLGTSEQSANERAITGFVFDGVTTQGTPNTTIIDFANPENAISENRFTRYGFEGVAEEAIVDGSFINLKSVDISYQIKRKGDHDFIREFDVGIYGKNLFTYNKYDGASPFRNLFDHTSARGLQFFNTPIISEIGVTLKLKL